MAAKGKSAKTMGAESVTLLRHMLEMELAKLREDNEFDVVIFMGVDGRIFSSSIAADLSPAQYSLMNLVKANLVHICGQLGSRNMQFSIQQYEAGTVYITGVGEKAFLLMFHTKPFELPKMTARAQSILVGSSVLKHLFDLRPISEAAMKGYPEAVVTELRRLTRRLFVDKYEESAEYKRNMDLLAFLREKLTVLTGVGAAQEILQLSLSEIGTPAKFMKVNQWNAVFERVIARVREQAGDIAAEKAAADWKAEFERKLRTFV